MKRPVAISMLVLVLGAAGYAALRYARVDRPRYPLPPDDPRCPPAMAYIPAGVGRIYEDPNPNGQPDPEEPRVVEMPIAAFCLDRNEVTVADYERCMASGTCAAPRPVEGKGRGCNSESGRFSNHPINCIDWNDAKKYCASQGKRLPLEEEWEYAAQGGAAHNHYPWGDKTEWRDRVCPPSIYGGTCAVRSYPAESFGLFDMAGNVTEATTHPCTLARPCDPDFAPYSGGGWQFDPDSHGPWGDVWGPRDPMSEGTRIHTAARNVIASYGIRCAK